MKEKWIALGMLFGAMALAEEADNKNGEGCRICGCLSKNSTGECAHCGTYRCEECKKYHIGDPARKCTEEGVDIPDAV